METGKSGAKASSPHLGPALAVTFLLRHYEDYGLSERVRYHFHLSEVLGDSAKLLTAAETNKDYSEDSSIQTAKKRVDTADTKAISNRSEDTPDANSAPNNRVYRSSAPCGVARVFECIPSSNHSRLTRQQKAFLKTSLVQLNQRLEEVEVPCSEPSRLPLRLNASTRISFAYEITRLVFLVDASPSMTSTFGIAQMDSSRDDHCCPMDRLPGMARTFFHALAEKVQLPYRQGAWQPVLSVSVLAVYPAALGDPTAGRTSILVRDWTVSDAASAETLVSRMEEWVLQHVEMEMTSRAQSRPDIHGCESDSILEGSSLAPTTFLDWWRAGKAALDSLTSAGRPCMVVATDGRSISTDRGLDGLNVSDIPFSVLDLSSPALQRSGDGSACSAQSMMQGDPGADFPLFMSDDREALFHISRTTGGCWWDDILLTEASGARVGQIAPDSPLAMDQYLGKLVRKHHPHMLRPNVVQWYTLFTLSALTPIFHENFGHLPLPAYLRQRMSPIDQPPSTMQYSAVKGKGSSTAFPLSTGGEFSSNEARKSHVRVQFSTYFINPVRILGLLVMRVKEGYRAVRYGQSTHDPDKVSIILQLALELGTSLYYEVAYRSLPGHNHMVGHAHIKIDISGEASFVQAVKTDFLQHHSVGQRRPVTLAQQVSSKLGRLLRSIRSEDLLQSYLSPITWTEKLLKPDSPFLRRLGALTEQQKVKHFRYDELDCVCVGRMPYTTHDSGFLDAFGDVDNGEEELLEALSSWSTRPVAPGENPRTITFLRKLGDGLDGLPCYCLLGIRKSSVAERLFTISIEVFEGSSSAPRRLAVLGSLRKMLSHLKDARVLEQQIGPFLMGTRRLFEVNGSAPSWREEFLSSQYLHKSWNLVYDKELLHLLMKRRAELGGFWLLDSNEHHALFARLHSREESSEQNQDNPGDMVQYQISILSDRVVVDLHMESEIGVFRNSAGSEPTGAGQFESLATNLMKRDQECGLALRARTQLLSAFDHKKASVYTFETLSDSVSRLLGYASRTEERLLAFHPSFVAANHTLLREFELLLVDPEFGPEVVALTIDPFQHSQEPGPGIWLLVHYDNQTSGILHVSSTVTISEDPSEGHSNATTIMTFYTISISDLYSRRDDFVGDDDSAQETVEEYMCTTEFKEKIMKEYDFVYSRAAYKALLQTRNQQSLIHMDDLTRVISPLRFHPFAEVMIESGGEKLVESLSLLVEEVPEEKYLFFFVLQESDTIPAASETISLVSSDSVTDRRSNGADVGVEMEASPEPDDKRPPIFIRFLLGDSNACMEDLRSFRRSAKLVALVSVFFSGLQSRSTLPQSHEKALGRVKRQLDAYVAEQTLDRLRRHGHSIENQDIGLARKCMRRASDVMSSEVEMAFYSSILDKVVSVSDDGGASQDLELGAVFLQNRLLSQSELEIRRVDTHKFIVLGECSDTALLPYWCFLDFDSNGIVSIECHHHSGPDEARTLLSQVCTLLARHLHTVNQMLILRHLHENRSATTLMIEQDGPLLVDENQESYVCCSCPFACPVVFRKTFQLFHRCATNPDQVARTVETTVLHIFALSNRRHVFVYKDESGSIFYMRLASNGGGLEPDGIVELLVHGIDEPTESLTKHLSSVISKKILSIAVDLLASVLTKNPRYAWRAADVDFVVDYNILRGVEENEKGSGPSTYLYALPESLVDPSAVLLYFRQNLCGSTYFHPFLSTNLVDNRAVENNAPVFLFYYNNYPSKLSPKLQGRSTLTGKGAEFARMAGQGLALIEVSLIDSECSQHTLLSPGTEIFHLAFPSNISAKYFLVKRFTETADLSAPGSGYLPNHFLKVSITDTFLNRQVLHDWVTLTLNQVSIGWCIERQLQRQQTGQCNPQVDAVVAHKNQGSTEDGLPGLAALVNTYEIAYKLPHPAVQKISFEGMVRSSSVASVALSLLELIIQSVVRECRGSQHVDMIRRTTVLRQSRDGKASLVKLSWGRTKRSCLVHVVSPGSDADKEELLVDSHIDCPHYVLSFSSPEYFANSDRTKAVFPKLFEEVNVGDDYQSDDRLVGIKNELPHVFQRSFAFFLSVKRNSRFLLAYNWRSDLFSAVASKLKAEDVALLDAVKQSSDLLQRRSLDFISPSASMKNFQSRNAARASGDAHSQKKGTHASLVSQTQIRDDMSRVDSRRAVRPISIRRPKLIGKSVEGSAMHAVQASRARASFKGSYGSAPSSGQKVDSAVSSSRAPLTGKKSRYGRPNADSRRLLTQEEEKTNRLIKEFRMKLEKHPILTRQHSVHQDTTNAFLRRLWPGKADSTKVLVAGEFLLGQTNLEFSASVEIPCSVGTIESIADDFAAHLVDSLGRHEIVRTVRKDKLASPVAFLVGESRKMKSTQCYPVLQIDVIQSDSGKRLLRCWQWVVTFRRSLTKTKDFFLCSQLTREKRANGPSKLATTLLTSSSIMETKMVEFLCGRAAEAFGSGKVACIMNYASLVLDVEKRYPISSQIRMLQTDYKVFSTPLVLKSFGNPCVDHFTSSTLFKWMLDNASSRGILPCGKKTVLLPGKINVDGVSAFCLLSDVDDSDRLVMSLVCRARNIDLLEYFFRPDSSLAITIGQNLAINAAGAAYGEVLIAATSLRRHSLWELASHEALRSHKEISNSIIEELLDLCATAPLYLSPGAKTECEELMQECFHGQVPHVCADMSLEETFSPSWTLAGGRRLFYMRAYDLFLLIRPENTASSLQVEFLHKSSGGFKDSDRAYGATQQFMNYLLHYIWSALLLET